MAGPAYSQRKLWGLVTAALLLTSMAPVGAGELAGLVPGSCKVHATHVLNPGCMSALTGETVSPRLTFPDLVPDVADVLIDRAPYWDFENQVLAYGPRSLYFDSRAQNLGTVPVELFTDDVPGVEETTVSQCVSWTADFVCRERRPVGGFEWHDEHRHFHYQDFAAYELRRVGLDGRPDYSTSGLLEQSEKVSFCLMDTEKVRDDGRPVKFYAECGTPTFQGISPGWTDIYGAYLPGQQLQLESHGDGRYALIVSLDPADHLYETDNALNRLEVIVDVTDNVQNVAIVEKHLTTL